jgi:Gpi18-like mannosyltransferase
MCGVMFKSEVVVVCAVSAMFFMVFFVPYIDYEEYFRFHVACSVGFSLKYVHSLIWLPVYQFIIALLRNFVLLRLFSVFCVVATSYFVRRLSGVLWSEEVAVATSVFYVLNPLVLLYGSFAMYESLATLLIVVFAYLFRVKKHFAASVVLGLAVLTSYMAWVFVPFILFYIVFKRERKLVFYIIPIIALVGWGLINFQLEKNPLHFVDLAQHYYQVLSQTYPMFANTTFSLFLFPLVYPLSFTFPFYVYLFRKSERNEAFFLPMYFVTSCMVLLVVGQALGYTFGWARYFIPLIPFILTMGSNSIYKSKYRLWMLIAYFALSLVSTVIQAQYAVDFKNEMINR